MSPVLSGTSADLNGILTTLTGEVIAVGDRRIYSMFP